MIKVIFVDQKDLETYEVSYVRDDLKYDPMKRQHFSCEVNHGIAHFIGKLRQEVKDDKL